MSEFMKRLAENNNLSEEKKSHWPEEVKKGKTYKIEFHADRASNGLSTFIGWAVTADGPIMKWQDAKGKAWDAFMYEGGMRAGDFNDNSRFTIGYED